MVECGMGTRWTIYCHTHVESGRRYVGLTKRTWQERWRGHVHLARRSSGHFARAIVKYGKDAFSHEVLEVCHSLEIANLAEECWIELFETRDPTKGFNLARGGFHVPHENRVNPWDQSGFREKVVSSLRSKNRDPAYKALRSKISNEVLSRPDVRSKLAYATAIQFSAPGSREAQAERVRALHGRPGYTEASMAGFRRHKVALAARTHCKHGHEFTPENTYVNKKGWRTCRACSRRSHARRVPLV